MNTPIYNTIGVGYNTTRRADPYITERIIANLQPVVDGLYLDLGCGTGNYLEALSNNGFEFYGIDPSETMLETAKAKCPSATLIQGKAEQMPFEDAMFNGAMGNFTLHHWDDIAKGLSELSRVLRSGSNAVFMSFTAAQMDGYWLRHYFPVMIQRSGALIPDQGAMIQLLKDAGFTSVRTEKYFIHEGLQDHFLYSNKYHPEQYLDPNIRRGISSFAAFATPEETEKGLIALDADIKSGKINDVIQQSENDLGDYLFYIATK